MGTYQQQADFDAASGADEEERERRQVCCDWNPLNGRTVCVGAISVATCTCGKMYRRCAEHGGQKGANRSRGAHRGLIHPGRDK